MGLDLTATDQVGMLQSERRVNTVLVLILSLDLLTIIKIQNDTGLYSDNLEGEKEKIITLKNYSISLSIN